VLDANRHFDWAQAQDMQIPSANRNSALDDHISEVHWKRSNPTTLKKCPLSQAKELFPQATAWHAVMTSGSKENDPKLAWCLEHWKAFKKTSPRPKDEPGGSSSALNDLNVLSSLRNQVSDKKPKLKTCIHQINRRGTMG
jgi:hypothetical protein